MQMKTKEVSFLLFHDLQRKRTWPGFRGVNPTLESRDLESGLEGEESPLLGGGSDANTVSAIGVPAIDGLGPRGRGFHTHDEYIEVSSLALRTAALTRFLHRCKTRNA